METEHDAGPLYDIARAVLQQIVQAYLEAEQDLPERQFVAPGALPAWDCPQLTVTVQALTRGVPGSQDQRPLSSCPPMRYARLHLELVRSTVVQRSNAVPAADKLEAAAKEVLRDLNLVEHALADGRAVIAGRGEAGRGLGIPVYIGNVTPLGPEGKLVGVQADIDVPV